MKKIVIVEDDAFMRMELQTAYEKAGYQTDCVTKFGEEEEQGTASTSGGASSPAMNSFISPVTEHILQMTPGLVVLDLNLPGVSGFQISRELKRTEALPVLILTSRDQMRDELCALDLGADEYLTKPCRRERLLARTANLLKRYEGRSGLLEGPGFLLDRQTYTMYIADQSVILPKNQGRLLEVFLLRRGETVTKEELSEALWKTTEYIDENALQVNLSRLKKTMKKLSVGWRIEFVRKNGYRMVPEKGGEDET